MIVTKGLGSSLLITQGYGTPGAAIPDVAKIKKIRYQKNKDKERLLRFSKIRYK